MRDLILKELKRHAPFTLFGALTGIVIMIFSYNMPEKVASAVFNVLHPAHVLLSALVTAAMYKNYKRARKKRILNILELLLVGFVGSIGIATLSDSLIPYLGETFLNMPHRAPHLGFIEHGAVIIPLAGIGIAIAYVWPKTKFPHAGHVLLSTWASLFHMIMARGNPLGIFSLVAVFVFLFLAVWIPCCVSDIIFPLVFINKKDLKLDH